MNGPTLNEFSCFQCLLGLKFTPDLKWNSYKQSIAKEARKMIDLLYCSRNYLTPPAFLYLYKSRIKHYLVRLHITDIYGLELLSSHFHTLIVQNHFCWLMQKDIFSSLQQPSYTCNATSLSLFHWQMFRRDPFFSSTSLDHYC